MFIGLRVKYPLLLSYFNETWISRQIFQKYSNMKFRKNPSSGSRVVPCGLTDMAGLVVAFRNFANAPKNCSSDTCVKGTKTPNAPHCYVILTFLSRCLFL